MVAQSHGVQAVTGWLKSFLGLFIVETSSESLLISELYSFGLNKGISTT
jgi:hypothetical protein